MVGHGKCTHNHCCCCQLRAVDLTHLVFCFSLVVGRWEVENVRIEHILSRTESEMLGRSTRNENSSGSRGSTPRINRNFVQPLVCFYRLRRNIQQKYSKGMAIPCVCVCCTHSKKCSPLFSFLYCATQMVCGWCNLRTRKRILNLTKFPRCSLPKWENTPSTAKLQMSIEFKTTTCGRITTYV